VGCGNNYIPPGQGFMKNLKIFFNIIYTFVIIFLIVISALLAFSSFKVPGGIKLFVVQSGSMEPNLKIGSIILTKSQDTYSLGDIITFYNNGASGTTTTHRIQKTEIISGKEEYITIGDANQGADREKVKTDSVLGKVIYIVPLLGYLVGFAKTQLGFTLLIVIPAVIIVFSEILNIKNEIVKKCAAASQKLN